jgi:hypothetical protein
MEDQNQKRWPKPVDAEKLAILKESLAVLEQIAELIHEPAVETRKAMPKEDKKANELNRLP